jgi:hypothetical protein
MSTVCANWATLSTETLIDNTIFLRGDLRLFSIGMDSLALMSRVRNTPATGTVELNEFAPD